jgi:hypothetical protein
MKRMWIIVQVYDVRYRKTVYDKIIRIVKEMSGEAVNSGGFGDVHVLAAFPHRKYKTVEKAIATALSTLPVKRTTVLSQDPFVVREKTFALTKELFERQDEVLGLSATQEPDQS